MKILLISGSLRTNSFNKKLVKAAGQLVPLNKNHQTEFVDLKKFDFPIFDEDLEKNGLPEGVQKWIETLKTADAIMLATPEYNSAISSPLKTAIDWASRSKPLVITRKPILLMGGSPGALAAVKGLVHTRVPLEALGNFVYPITFGVPQIHEVLDEQGQFKNKDLETKLKNLVEAFCDYATKLNLKSE